MRRTTIAGTVALCAMLAAGCAKPPPAKQVLRKSAAVYYKAKTLKIEAENSQRLQVDKQWQEKGSLILTELEKPNKMRQQVVGAKQPSVVSDGQKAYFYMDQMQSYVQVQPDRLMAGISQDPAGGPVLRFATDKEPLKDIKGAKLLGDEKIGEVDTYVVQFTPTTPMRGGLENAKLSQRLWIGKEDFLVRKTELVAITERDDKGEKQKFVMTLTSLIKTQDVDATIPASEFTLPKGAKTMQMPPMPQTPAHP